MRKLLASASFLVLSSASVLAADLPLKAAPIIAPVYTWTGFYIGVHGGGGAMNDSNTSSFGSSSQVPTNFLGTSSVGNESIGSGGNNAFHGTGGLAGGQLGYNYQITNVVFGIEGEGYWSGMKGTFDRSTNFFGDPPLSGILSRTDLVHLQTQNKYDFTIAGRMGIAFDRTLVYGKAGWAWGKFDAFSSVSDNTFAPVFATPTSSLDTASWGGTLNGPLFGLGIEYLITNNWTAKLEYNYIVYGTRSFATLSCSSSTGSPSTCVGNGQSSGNTPLGADKQIFKFGVNYKFDWAPLPVTA
ncbi:MAG TPA: outer membrane beta-barrel protein, partial [Bradyrhizobium sp.]|nr:outer membrane beta-barrel protein [Bradyrhizobium sp.]